MSLNRRDLVVLVGRHYWAGLLRWIHSRMLTEKKISPGDLDLVVVTDDPREAADFIAAAWRAQMEEAADMTRTAWQSQVERMEREAKRLSDMAHRGI